MLKPYNFMVFNALNKLISICFRLSVLTSKPDTNVDKR